MKINFKLLSAAYLMQNIGRVSEIRAYYDYPFPFVGVRLGDSHLLSFALLLEGRVSEIRAY
jgi:hypothetical protein